MAKVTETNVDRYFHGVMIECTDPFTGTHRVPGWECKRCGWRVGTSGLPPTHECKKKEDA